MKKLGVLALLTLVLLTVALPASAQSAFEESDCAFAVPEGANVTCGFLTVPEDRSEESDPADTIRLAVAVFESEADAPAEDPVVFLQGGPGGGAITTAAQLYSTFVAPFTETRDFIVFDQRGTGLSEPALNCPQVTELQNGVIVGSIAREEYFTASLEAVEACRAELESEQGVNPAAYTSAASAADIADLVSALGHEQVNLFGASYGTHLALVTARDYPEIVRSLVLDSVSPVELNRAVEQAPKYGLALDALFAACETDPACSSAFPDLETLFYDTVDALDADPGALTITNPSTGETLDAVIDGSALISGTFFALQVEPFIAGVPQMIASVSEGDYSALATSLTIPLIIGDLINAGVLFSVFCAEEVYAGTTAELEASVSAVPQLESFNRFAIYGGGEQFNELCRVWGAAEFDPRDAEAVITDIPTLLLSGAFDPATPPVWAEQAAANLENSYNYVLPASGHTPTTTNACAHSIAVTFLEDPTTAPDASCIDEQQIAFTTPAGVADTAFTEVTSDAFGYRSIVPEGWTEAGPGVYAGAGGQAILLQQALPGTIGEAQALLSQQLGFESFPEPTGVRDTDALSWALYNLQFQGQNIELAMAEGDGTTYIVLLQSPVSQAETYFSGVLEPVLDAFTPAG